MTISRPLRLYIIGGIIAWPLISGLLFADHYSMFCPIGIHRDISSFSARRTWGFAAALGALGTLTWPASLPASYAMTGFAEGGFGPWNTCSTRLQQEVR